MFCRNSHSCRGVRLEGTREMGAVDGLEVDDDAADDIVAAEEGAGASSLHHLGSISSRS
jgi:hypothetical protein